MQYPAGGLVRTAQGTLLRLRADTAAGGFPPLGDTGIPWVYVDSTARAGFQYFYKVTAFDVNSLISGPSSMESESELHAVVPQPLGAVADRLADIRVAPDPYYGGSTYDLGPADRRLRFFNLPPRATIRIYTVSGVLVDVIQHEGVDGASIATWDLTNHTLMVASGVYLYHVTTPDGDEHTGRFTVITGGWPM